MPYLAHAETQRLLEAAESPVNAKGMALTSQYKSPVIRSLIQGVRNAYIYSVLWIGSV